MRAPPESFRPTTGEPSFIARSMILTIFAALVSESDPPNDGEVLREGEHLAAVDEAVAGDDAVAGHDLVGHAEVAAAVGDELVELLERAGIEQQLDPLARGQLAGGVLRVEPLLAAAELGAPLEVREDLVGLQAFTAWTFSQSFRNFSRPIVVSGWLNSARSPPAGRSRCRRPSAPLR